LKVETRIIFDLSLSENAQVDGNDADSSVFEWQYATPDLTIDTDSSERVFPITIPILTNDDEYVELSVTRADGKTLCSLASSPSLPVSPRRAR